MVIIKQNRPSVVGSLRNTLKMGYGVICYCNWIEKEVLFNFLVF